MDAAKKNGGGEFSYPTWWLFGAAVLCKQSNSLKKHCFTFANSTERVPGLVIVMTSSWWVWIGRLSMRSLVAYTFTMLIDFMNIFFQKQTCEFK